MAYLHRKGIIHKDLNVEHIQLLKTGLYVNIKLAEFGHSRRVSGIPVEETIVGDIYYQAPEAFEGRYSEKSDI